MKKTLLLCMMLWGTAAIASSDPLFPISFSAEIIKEKPIHHSYPKSPADPPTVYLEDYTLTFETDHPEYILYIKDEDEVVVYSTVVTSATTEVVLPSTLSGDYEIELIMGDWMFTGWINL